MDDRRRFTLPIRRELELAFSIHLAAMRLVAMPARIRLVRICRLKTGCAMRGEKIADVVRALIEREFPPQS
jgi:hypothetical protein